MPRVSVEREQGSGDGHGAAEWLEICSLGALRRSGTMLKHRTQNQRDLLGLAVVAGVCVLFTVLLTRALWISGDSVGEVETVRSGRSWGTVSYALFILIVFDLIVLAAFLKSLKQAGSGRSRNP